METVAVVERFLASPGLSPATRRAYASDLRDFTSWLDSAGLTPDRVDARALTDYLGELGRARRGLAPATIARRLSAVRALLRYALGPERVPQTGITTRPRRRLPDAPRLEEVEELIDADHDESPLGLRNRALLELTYSCGLRSAEVVALDLADVDLDRERGARPGQGGQGAGRPARRGGGVRRGALSPRRAARADAWRLRCGVPLGPWTAARHKRAAPARCQTRIDCDTPTRPTCSREAPTCARSRSSSVTARSRQPRSTATSTRGAFAGSTTVRTRARSVLQDVRAQRQRIASRRAQPSRRPGSRARALAAPSRRAAVATHGRRLSPRPRARSAAARGGPAGDATAPGDRSLARRDACRGLAGSTHARRLAAARSYFRHSMLLGARGKTTRRPAITPPAAARESFPARSHPPRPSG